MNCIAQYIATLRTPGGLLQDVTFKAYSWSHAYHCVRELWPGLHIVRIIQDGEW